MRSEERRDLRFRFAFFARVWPSSTNYCMLHWIMNGLFYLNTTHTTQSIQFKGVEEEVYRDIYGKWLMSMCGHSGWGSALSYRTKIWYNLSPRSAYIHINLLCWYDMIKIQWMFAIYVSVVCIYDIMYTLLYLQCILFLTFFFYSIRYPHHIRH